MAEPEPTEKSIRSFGLDNSTLQTHPHHFVNFSPRLQRQFSERAETLAEKSCKSRSPPKQIESAQSEARPTESNEAKESPQSKRHVSSSEDEAIALSVYGNLYGKPKLPKGMRQTVQKRKETAAKNQKKKAQEGENEEAKGSDEKQTVKRGRKRANSGAKERATKSEVTLSKGKSYDGVTKHVTVKANRKKHGMFGGTTKVRGIKKGAKDGDKKVNDGNAESGKSEDRMADKPKNSKRAKEADREEKSKP